MSNILLNQFNTRNFLEIVNCFREEMLVLNFKDGVDMLNEAGFEQGHFDDLGSKEEKALGAIVKEKYGTDFYILDKYPLDERAFYSMPDPEDPV